MISTDPLTQTTKPINNILIVGSGAMGLLWYSHFYLHAKESTHCYLYQSSYKQKTPNKFHFTALNQQKSTILSSVITDNTHQKIDIILICVKSYQLNQAIKDILDFISSNTVVIISHNGLGALNNETSKLLINNITLDLLTTHGCLKRSNNEIIHTGAGLSHVGVKFGQPNKTISYNIVKQLNTILPEVIWCNDILTKQWLKLTINCVINPLTALFDIKNGDIVQNKFEKTIDVLINEIIIIAKEKQIDLNHVQLKETIFIDGIIILFLKQNI